MLRAYLEQTIQDLRFAPRTLLKSPAFATVAVATLALGIGANTAVFSILDGSLLRPLPYSDPDRLVVVWDKGIGESNLAKIFASYKDFEAFQENARAFDRIAAATWAVPPEILTGTGPARTVLAIPVTAQFFSMLGVQAAHGRTFSPDDLKHACSVVLADAFWRETLGTREDIVGRSITLDRRDCNVVGVMPPSFSFYPAPARLWTLITPDFAIPRDRLVVGIFGRLKHGVTIAQAQSELTAIHTAIHQADGRERTFMPVAYDLQSEFTFLAGRNLTATLWILFAAVTMVLLIACLNLASLLLGRSFARSREMAIRAALGSGRGRLMRQLLAEALVLSSAGGTLGIFIAYAAIRYFRAANPIELPVGAEIAISLPVLAFSLGISLATSLVFALLPAWKTARADLNEVLKSGASTPTVSRQRLARLLLASEMALSVVLLGAAGVLIESILRIGSAPLGFDPEHVLTAALTLPPSAYSDDNRRRRFYDDLDRRLNSLSGVAAAALTSSVPPLGGSNEAIEVQGRELLTTAAEIHDVSERQVSPGYFRVFRMPLLSGRVFDARDREDTQPVGIVNQALVRRYFPKGDALGRRIRPRDPQHPKPWIAIVGVVPEEKHAIVFQEMNWIEPCILFRPVSQDPPHGISLVVRSAGASGVTAMDIQRAVASLDSRIPASTTESLTAAISRLFSYPRFRAIVFAGFALFALLLAAIGLHGVLQQFVIQHTQEIGIRMAIGARTRDVVSLIARQGGQSAFVGLAVGLFSASALNRYLVNLLYGVKPGDPLTLATVSAILLATAALAMIIPARRASRVDPIVALRYE